MGRHESWVAVRGKSVEDVVRDLPAFEMDGPTFVWAKRLPTKRFSCLTCRDGWILVDTGGHNWHRSLAEGDAIRLSRGADSLYFQCDDTSVVSSIKSFTDGRKTWELAYSGLDGIDPNGITAFGSPPRLVEKAIAHALQEVELDLAPDPLDYFYEIAASIGETLTGYHHERDVPNFVVQPLRERT